MDFSKYGEPTEELTSYLSAHPDLTKAGPGKPEESLADWYTIATAHREAFDRQRLKKSGLEGKYTTQDHKVPTRDGSSIPLRLYTPNGPAPSEGRPIYVHFHGGGMTNGSLNTESSLCATITTTHNILVLHPCYRHLHEAQHPTQHSDAWDAISWISVNMASFGGDLRNLVIGGISSGGTLAASVTQKFFASEKAHGNRNGLGSVNIKGQVLIVPWLIQPAVFPYHLFVDRERTSLSQCSSVSTLSMERLEWLSSILGAEDIGDEMLNPALVDNEVLRKLPKTAFIVGGGDMLRDDSLIYAGRLERVGVPTKVHVFTGMPHPFLFYDGLLTAKIGMDRLLESIRWALEDGDDQVGMEWISEPTS